MRIAILFLYAATHAKGHRVTQLKFADSVSRLGTESAFVVLAHAQKLVAEGRDITNLGIG